MTGGCRWAEKSFSVAVKNKQDIVCRECDSPTDGSYKYNGDYLCKECFSKKSPAKNRLIGFFNTHKDLGYNFTTEMFDGKPIEVHSQRHYKSLLKKYGMVDASIKECRQEADFRKRIKQEDYSRDRRKTAENIYSKLRNRGQLNGRK